MTVAHDLRLQEASEYAKNLFRGDPELTIDKAARMVNENKKRGLVKHTLAGLRREVRLEMQKEGSDMVTARKLSDAVKPAPASAEARATKVDRVKFLESWALENPMATLEQAREAVRTQFGIALGSEIISNTMRLARDAWESQRKAAVRAHAPLEAPTALTQEQAPVTGPEAVAVAPLQVQVQTWAKAMKESGIRLVEILPDGGVRFELAAL